MITELPVQYQGDPKDNDDGVGTFGCWRSEDKYYVGYFIKKQPVDEVAQVGITPLEGEGSTYQEAEANLLAILNSLEVTTE